MARDFPRMLSSLAIGVGVIAIIGCTKVPPVSEQTSSNQSVLIENIENRLKQLELRMGKQKASSDSDNKAPAGPIKSLTFRKGSDDDRLRIYWADGSSSDLPCTQEQATLACG